MIGDIRLAEESVGIAGDIFILDAAVASASHFAKFSPTVVKKFLIAVQEAYPVKVKEVHVINISPLVDTIFNFVKPFVKEKIRSRITFHNDVESLYKVVPRELLPNEYGGKAGPIVELNQWWKKKLADNTEWFKEQEDKKANESLRPGAPKTTDDLFGMEGTFRQLNIDWDYNYTQYVSYVYLIYYLILTTHPFYCPFTFILFAFRFIPYLCMYCMLTHIAPKCSNYNKETAAY